MRIPQGTYSARAVSATPTTKGENKTPAVTVVFHLNDGEAKGTLIEWDGYLTPGARQRTSESLEYCGFDGEDLASCCTRDVQLVIEDEEYRGVVRSKVKWVNDPDRAGSTRPMDQAQRAQALADLKGLILSNREKRGQTGQAAKPARAPEAPPKFDFGGVGASPPDPASFVGANAPANPGPGYPDPKAGF